jgi:sugar lactone lactonase YvrE
MERLHGGGGFFEGPRWHDGAWYVSDFYDRRVLRIEPDGSSDEVAFVEQQPSGLGWLPDGSLLIVSMKDRRVLRRNGDGSLREHGTLAALITGYANDMAVDGLGRAFVGSFGFDLFGGSTPAPGAISCIRPDGYAAVVADGLRFPNGIIVTSDNRTLIVSETFGARLTAFTIHEDGSLHDRRVWAQAGREPSFESVETIVDTDFAPDGCVLDAQGCVWVADAIGSRAVRVESGGSILDEVPAPDGLGLYSCTLGGPEGRTLLVCTAPGFAEQERKATREAELFQCEVDVPRADGAVP